MFLWTLRCPSEVWLRDPFLYAGHLGLSTLPALPRLGLGCPGLRVHTTWRTGRGSAYSVLGLVWGPLVMPLRQSGGLPRSSELRLQRLQGQMCHCPIVGVLLLTPGHGSPWLRLRVYVLAGWPLLVHLLVLLLDHCQQLLLLVQEALVLLLLLLDHLQQHGMLQHLRPAGLCVGTRGQSLCRAQVAPRLGRSFWAQHRPLQRWQRPF